MDEHVFDDQPGPSIRAIPPAGVSRSTVLDELEELMLKTRAEGRFDLQTAVIEVGDYVEGWCSPGASL